MVRTLLNSDGVNLPLVWNALLPGLLLEAPRWLGKMTPGLWCHDADDDAYVPTTRGSIREGLKALDRVCPLPYFVSFCLSARTTCLTLVARPREVSVAYSRWPLPHLGFISRNNYFQSCPLISTDFYFTALAGLDLTLPSPFLLFRIPCPHGKVVWIHNLHM